MMLRFVYLVFASVFMWLSATAAPADISQVPADDIETVEVYRKLDQRDIESRALFKRDGADCVRIAR